MSIKDIEMKVSFVIPVFNNADTVGLLSQMLSDVSSNMRWDYEIIFVDDCSKDNSVETLSALTSNCGIIRLKQNQGQSTAVLTGMKYSSGDFIVVMDADLQDSPDFVPQFIGKFTEETDVVFSGRTGDYEKKAKLFSAKGFKYLLHLLSRKRLPHNACMFFAIRKKATQKLIPYAGSHPYLLSVIAKTKLNCKSIPCIRKENTSGKSSYNFIKRWKVGLKGISNFIFLQPKQIDMNLISVIRMPAG